MGEESLLVKTYAIGGTFGLRGCFLDRNKFRLHRTYVPAFPPADISAIGPLALLAIVHTTVGLGCGLVIREVCCVPGNFLLHSNLLSADGVLLRRITAVSFRKRQLPMALIRYSQLMVMNAITSGRKQDVLLVSS